MKKFLSIASLFVSFNTTSFAETASQLIPSHGMTCLSSTGYSMSVYLVAANRIEVELTDRMNRLLDDNFYSVTTTMDPSIHEYIIEALEDGAVELMIRGLEEDTVTKASIFYDNAVTGLSVVFDECDII